MSALESPEWLSIPPERRRQLLDDNRNINVDHEWWSSTFGQFAVDLAEIGIGVDSYSDGTPRIYFSGFSNQGDGASFHGYVFDWPKLLTALNAAEFTDQIWGWTFSSRTSGRYAHSGTMTFHGELPLEPNPFDPDDEILQHECWAATHKTEAELDALWDRIKAKFIELADQLYSRLEAEYNHLTSDEQVAETLLSNDLIHEEESSF